MNNFTMKDFIYELMALVDNDKYKYSGKWVILRHFISGKKDLEKGKKIMSEGLVIDSGSALYTTTPLGRLDYNEVYNIFKQNIEYLNPNSCESGILVAVPVELLNSKGEKIYWGEVTRKYESDKYNCSSIVDYFFKNMRGIDPKFILGYFEQDGDNVNFKFNDDFISFMSNERKDKFFNAVKEILSEELNLPLLNPNISKEEIIEIKEIYEKSNLPFASNYILKTILQMLDDYNILDKKNLK